MLVRRGLKTPQQQLRDFLNSNPGHLDAKRDLLKELRRLALRLIPTDLAEDLCDEDDQRIWGAFAAEADRLFSGTWHGIGLTFFQPHITQPERYSKLMRAVFTKHIFEAESAIRHDPFNNPVWNVWAWMARSLPGYKWQPFINSLGLVHLPYEPSMLSLPPSDVAVWFVEESAKSADWEAVLQFATYGELAMIFDSSTAGFRREWLPGSGGYSLLREAVEGHPVKTVYLPQLEAHLRLGNIDEANYVYEWIIANGAGNAPLAAIAARSVGMEELARLYESGKAINAEPARLHYFYIFADRQSVFHRQFESLAMHLSPNGMRRRSAWNDENDFGWRMEDGERWALVYQGRILAQGTAVPQKDEMQAILKRSNIIGAAEFYKEYLAERGSLPGIELFLAYQDINQSIGLRSASPAGGEELRPASGETEWGDAIRRFRRALRLPEVLLNDFFPALPYTHPASNLDALKDIQDMKALSAQYLPHIESLLERSPTLEHLWNQWMFWRGVEDRGRPIKPLLERISHSPFSPSQEALPNHVTNIYYEECKRTENWAEAISLLRAAWDRETERNSEFQNSGLQNTAAGPTARAGLRLYQLGILVIPLIEAYLHGDKPYEADEIFNAYLDAGGRFIDMEKIVELAKEKGHTGLAEAWGQKTAVLQNE